MKIFYGFLAIILLTMGIVGYLMFGQEPDKLHFPWWEGNPRMKHQAHLRSFETHMPNPVEGTVPVDTQPAPKPTIPRTPENLHAGEVTYGYYCLQCHGQVGDGNGPVGESYFPKPADLRSAKIRQYTDAELMKRMIEGTGHAPALSYIVKPYHKPFVVLYVRELQEKANTESPISNPE